MIKKIAVIGVGKLGLCLSLNLEKNGFEVLGVDIDKDYIELLNTKKLKTSEPMVEELLKSSKNIRFTDDLSKCLNSDVIFIVVKTPSTSDWKYDHSQIEQVIDKLISYGKQDKKIELVINSTTFPGYCEDLQKKVKEFNYKISYNPEFIAQGSIIQDQVNADMVLIGECDNESGNVISEIYQKICKSNPKIIKMSRTEAEICKLSINCFLTTKISFANMISDISERMNCDPKKILMGVGSDSRIGLKYLNPGFGFGGPCFPRDNRALYKCAEDVGVEAVISKATDLMNEKHLGYQIDLFKKLNPNKEIPVNIDYVTYKKESTSIEESQQLKYAINLYKEGYNIKIMDDREEVISQIKNLFL